MVEVLRDSHELDTSSPKSVETARSLGKKPEKLKSLEEIRQKVEEEALSANTTLYKEEQTEEKNQQQNDSLLNSASPQLISKDIKNMAYRRILKRMRKQLPFGSRLASHLIHQPFVEEISEVSARSIGSPRVLLGTGILGFISSVIYYLLATNYGLNYSFTVITLLIAAGLILGWFSELMLRLFGQRQP